MTSVKLHTNSQLLNIYELLQVRSLANGNDVWLEAYDKSQGFLHESAVLFIHVRRLDSDFAGSESEKHD